MFRWTFLEVQGLRLPSSAEGVGSVPGREAGLLHALRPKNQNIKNRGHVATSSIKTFKKWSTSKNF